MTPLLILSVTLAAPIPKAPEKAEAKLDGVWVLKAMEFRGMERPPTDALRPTYTLIVAGDDYVFRTHGGTIKFDKEKKTFEVTVTGATYKGETSGGVFERDGNTLKLAMPSIPRTATAKPTELKTTQTTTHYLYTFELDKDVKADKAAEDLKTRLAALPVGKGGFPGGAFPGGAGGGVVRPAPAAIQLQAALERIEKLEKRVEELEKEKAKKEEKK